MRSICVLAGVLPILFAAAATGASAQAPLEVDGRLIPSGIDTVTVSYSGLVLGHGITERARVDAADGVLLLQVYTWHPAVGGGVVVDSLYMEERSLRSVREIRVLGDTTIHARFGEDAIRVSTRVSGAEIGEAVVPVGGAVYSSAALEMLAAAAPLAPEYEAEVRLYFAPPADAGVVPLRLSVLTSESVRGPAGVKREAWVVHATTPGGGTTYWIDKQTRSVLKFDTREGTALIEFRR